VKLLVCSDCHANLRALDAVLAEYGRLGPCRFLFLGDAVGYGSHPRECLDRLLGIKGAQLVTGNHDRAVLDLAERETFNEEAFKVIEWTVDELNGDYDGILDERFRLESDEIDFLATHGNPVRPEDFEYIFSIIDAERAFLNRDFSVCFVGHTHIPLVYTYMGGPKDLKPGEPLELSPSDRYIINPGSVGQPRDGDNRASFIVYDPDERTVTLNRVEYDIEAEAADMKAAGLPERFAERLFRGR
jgi:predicted phosphodiesterase